MSADLKFVRHPTFPQANATNLASGWFWKMTMREWAIAQLDVVDTAVMPVSFTGGTNNPGVVRFLSSTRSPDGKKFTLKFYAASSGQAYVHLRDTAGPDPFGAVDKKLMQLVVEMRRAPTESAISYTTLNGTTFAVNAPDTDCYELGTTTKFQSPDPLKLFEKMTGKPNHVVIASHGITVGQDVCLFIGGAKSPSSRLGLTNVETVFAQLKGKVADKCIVWLGGCGIGSNDEFCNKAAKASGCPVIAAAHVLVNKKSPKGVVDILDRVSQPKLFLPTPDASGKFPPRSLGDFCADQEAWQFSVPI